MYESFSLKRIFSILSPFIFLMFSGCFGNSDESAPNAIQFFSRNTSSSLRQDIDSFSYQVESDGGDGTSFTLEGAPEGITISSSGLVSGIPIQGGEFSMKVKANNSGRVGAQTVPLTVIGDPLVHQAWHYKNRGQSTFASSGGIANADLNVQRLHLEENLTGKDIVVVVADEGLEIRHEDLVANILPGRSKNYLGGGPNFLGDPTNVSPGHSGDHGTSVAGIIAAKGWNLVGSRGIAPDASLIGYNFLQNQSDDSLVDQATGSDVHIFNQSFGFVSATFKKVGNGANDIDPDYIEQLAFGNLRHLDGKGSLYIRSAGNAFFVRPDPPISEDQALFSLHPNLYADNSNPYVVLVGALNANYIKASYSSVGANLWVSAPGGEFGDDDPAILTVDETGCGKGYSQSNSSTNAFESGGSGNSNCNYTSIFNGTSSAAPAVSGVSALIRKANPDLSARAVKHVLALSARKVDPSFVAKNLTVGGETYVQEPGWIRNGANLEFHNWYGFGAVDADAAVILAKNFAPLPPMQQTVTRGGCTPAAIPFCADDAWKYSESPNSLIPDGNKDGTTSFISVTEDWTVETIQIRLSLAVNGSPNPLPFPIDLAVELESPAGTRSILLNARSLIDRTETFNDVVLLSNAFFRESATGNWTLRIVDTLTNNRTWNLTNWKLNIVGYDAN